MYFKRGFMELAVLAFGMILFCGVILWILDKAREERQELHAAFMAKSLPEYAMNVQQMKITAKERTKIMKLENELALANQKILDAQGEDRGIVVT